MQQKKDLIIGVIRSATQKAGKQIETGKLVTGEQFEKILEEQNKYDDLLFIVESLVISSGREITGNPQVEIFCSANGYFFKASFMVKKPHGKFENETPFAHYFSIEELKG